MRIVADLHIHSRYSRATSPKLDPAHLERWARIKGIGLLGTGDCTHPRWLAELRENLEDAEPGLYTLKNDIRAAFDSGSTLAEELPRPGGGASGNAPRFALSGEISTIYKRGGKTRKVHHLILLPDFRAAAALQTRLERAGNITSDGRPILGLDSRDLLAMLLDANENSLLIPAHIWTPWFSALGAKSGFDSIEECYGDLVSHIPAIETGLSSDPPMNWALSSLDRYAIISNSDAHSPDKLGREATVFDTELSFAGLRSALFLDGRTIAAEVSANNSPKTRADILATIEFFPEEGKYHYDGHRKCGVCLGPADEAESVAGEKMCPVCGKALTRGVMGRVTELADRIYDGMRNGAAEMPASCNRRPFHSLIPLREILGELLGTGPASKKVDAAYGALIEKTESELAILMEMPLEAIGRMHAGALSGELLGEAIARMRRGEVSIAAGYDGEYGVVRVFPPGADTGSGGSLFEEYGGIDAGNAVDGNSAADNAIAPHVKKPARKKSSAGRRNTRAGSGLIQNSNPAVVDFDPAQKAIINHEGKRAIIIAGPGTGKTAVLAARIAKIVNEGINGSPAPGSILALSFTVKAAAELRERINGLLRAQQPGNAASGNSPVDAVQTATFHSFCCALLREQAERVGIAAGFAIADESRRNELLREVCAADRGKTAPAKLGRYIEERKRFLLLPGEERPRFIDAAALFTSPENLPPLPQAVPEMEALYGRYRGRLHELGLLDFDDLIAGTVRLFVARPEILAEYRRRLRHLFVDEYQDINLSQYILLRLLADGGEGRTAAVGSGGSGSDGDGAGSERPSLWVIGDPNQAIYGFRGSDKQFIDRFMSDYPGASRFELARSFRCAGPIIHAAGRLAGAGLTGTGRPVDLYRAEYPTDKSEAEGVARAISRLIGGASFFALDTGVADSGVAAGDTYTAAGSGGIAHNGGIPRGNASSVAASNTGNVYADTAAPADCAILVRAAPLAGPVIKALTDHGIPFEYSGEQPWWEEEPFAPFLARVRESAASAPDTTPEEEFTKGKDDPRLARLFELARMLGGVGPLLDALALSDSGGLGGYNREGVKIMTIHAAKGLEFDHVFVIGLEDGILPFTLFGEDSPAHHDEERRLLYVAMTRARVGLCLSWARSRNFRGRVLEGKPSPFLGELEKIVPLLEEKRSLKKDRQLSLFQN